MNNPTFELSLDKTLALSEIESKIGIPQSEIRKDIEYFISDYYKRFGLEPFYLEFHRLNGYMLRANAYIGFLILPYFNLELVPKVSGLTIGKALQLANTYSGSILVKHFNKLIEKNVSDKESLTNVDYYSASYASVITDLIKNGLVTQSDFQEGTASRIKGRLLFNKNINKAATPLKPYMKWPIRSKDTPANRTLKAALTTLLKSTSNRSVAGMLQECINHFDLVKEVDRDFSYEMPGTVPRQDYKIALSLSKSILETHSFDEGKEGSFMPSFALDLDSLFEVVVANGLATISKLLEILPQKESLHDIEPKLSLKKIKPDILIRKVKNKNSGLVILDTKNKYSELQDDGQVSISNPDLYQLAYYCKTLHTNQAVLVYPGNSKTSTKYPIKSSESKEKYDDKRKKAFQDIYAKNRLEVFSSLPSSERVNLYIWTINLTGTIEDTKRSLASLTLFLSDLIK